MKLKLDLHTHCYEALGFPEPSIETVRVIIEAAKKKGLDGLAITEHYSKRYGFLSRDIAQKNFSDSFIIIPGQETRVYTQEVVELYLEGDRVFRFLAHPYTLYGFERHEYNIQGIEIDNHLHDGYIYREGVRRLAAQKRLLLLRNSDAHNLEALGSFYNLISLAEINSPLPIAFRSSSP
jgi:hypothetical protein